MPKVTATTKAKATKTKATKRATSKKAKTTLPKTTSRRNGTQMGVMTEETKRLTIRSFQLAYEAHQREKLNGQSDV